ncbi:MAG: prepilin-type N-terminal cleavage/methylation domain-containing protein [Nitrospirae bacterium]|nr:prepilin-type N-terminal cleavage/methylation domain-containing protein [Nitrospirota bacterium]
MKPAEHKLGNKGYTLVELVIAAAIAAVVLYGLTQAFKALSNSYQSAKLNTELQQNVRSTVEQLTRLTSMAGYAGGCLVDADKHVHGLVYKRAPADHVPFTDTTDDSFDIIASSANSLCFTFWDEDPAYEYDDAMYTREKRLRIYHNAATDKVYAIIERCKVEDASSESEKFEVMPGMPVELAEDITSLEFRYIKSNNEDITGTLSDDTIKEVRKVELIVTGKSSRKDPSTITKTSSGRFITYSLMSDVRPFNLGLEGQVADVTPPVVPSGLSASDPHNCGDIRLHWHPNTEIDIAGYEVNWGLDSSLGERQRFGNVTACTITVMSTNTDYYFGLSAYDTSGLGSATSAPIHTDGVNDTTSNPDEPSVAPVNYRATAGPGNGEITLAWDMHPDPDVTYYEIYRKMITNTDSISGFTYPAVASTPGVTTLVADKVAFDTLVTTTAGGYEFTDSNLIGCRMYDYAVVPRVWCDTAAPLLKDSYPDTVFARAYGNGGDIGTGTPKDNTVPPDDQSPSPPTQFVAIPGANRVFLTWQNPSDADIDRIQIVRTDAYPFPDTLSDGVLAYDSATDPAYIGDPGATNSGKIDDGDVQNDLCYYYTAFAVDRCEHVSADWDATSVPPSWEQQGTHSRNSVDGEEACARPCDDDPAGNPQSPPLGTFTAGYCSNPVPRVAIRWGDPTPLDSDTVGYKAYRATGTTASHTETALLSNIKGTGGYNVYSDTGATEGEIYTYYVRQEDCSNKLSDTTGITDVTAYPGKVYYNSAAATRVTGTYYNAVRITGKNSSRYNAWLNGVTLSWSGGGRETDAFLTKVQIWDGVAYSTVYDGPAVTSGTYVPFGAGNQAYDARFLRAATSLTARPYFYLSFTFKTAAGLVNSTVDMRDASMTISYDFDLYYRLNGGDPIRQDSSLAGSCQDEVYTVMKPTGPTFMQVTQNQPRTSTISVTNTGLIRVPASALTDVSTYVTDTSAAATGIESVKLFYAFTNRTTSRPPSVGSIPDAINRKTASNPRGFTGMTTVAVNPGSDFVQYKTTFGTDGHPVPASNDSRVWYFLVATDNDGNFTRWPQQADPDVAFNYDQNPAGPSDSDTYTVSATITSPAALAVVGNTVNITGTATSSSADPTLQVSSVQVQIDGGAWSDCVYNSVTHAWTFGWVTDPGDVAPGVARTITVIASAGSGDSLKTATVTRTVTVNNTPSASCSITSPLNGAEVLGPVNVTVNAAASPGTPDEVAVTVDGGATWNPAIYNSGTGLYEFLWSTTSVADSPPNYTLQARAVKDTVTANSAAVSVTVNNPDNVSCQIVSPVNNSTVSGVVNVQIAAASNGSFTVQVSFDDGATWTTIGAPGASGYYERSWDTAAFDDVWKNIKARATKGVVTANDAVKVYVNNDVTVTCDITSPASGSTVFSTVPITVNATSSPTALSGVTATIDGVPHAMTDSGGGTYTYNWDTSVYGDGTSHTITVTATSGVNTATDSITVTKNSGSVTLTISNPAAGSVQTGTFTVQAQASTDVGTIDAVEVSTDGLSWAGTTLVGANYEQTYTISTPRNCEAWTVYVRATNSQQVQTTRSVSFTVNTASSLLCEITSPTGGTLPGVYGASRPVTTRIMLNAPSTGNPVTSVDVSIDGGAWMPAVLETTPTWHYDWTLPEGETLTAHTINARARIVATCSTTTANATQVNVNVDTVVPALAMVNLTHSTPTVTLTLISTDVANPTRIYRGKAVTWRQSSTDTGGSGVKSVKMYYNGSLNYTALTGTAGTFTFPAVTLPATPNQSRTFYFEAEDNAGNVTLSPFYYIRTN